MTKEKMVKVRGGRKQFLGHFVRALGVLLGITLFVLMLCLFAEGMTTHNYQMAGAGFIVLLVCIAALVAFLHLDDEERPAQITDNPGDW